MSEELPIKSTNKLGGGYEAPWLSIDAANPEDLNFKAKAIIEHPELVQNLVELSNVLKAAYSAGPLLPGNTPSAPEQQFQQQVAQQGPPPAWGQTPAAQQQGAAPAQQRHQGGQRFAGGPLHPEGKTCEACPNVLEKKQTSSGKNVWRCDAWRWNSGSPNGHTNIFID